MAEKAIRLGGESTADAIVSAVDAMYTEHTFAEKDFALKHNEDEISVDTNFAAQNFWKEALIRFFNKKSAVLGLVLIVIIVLLAVLGPGMNSYTYSGQDLSQKNFAPRVPGIEQFGILDGSEPTVETDLGDVWFRPVTGGYMGYIPVTYNAEGGPHTLTVTCGSLTQELTLSVMQSEAKTVDVAAEADIPGAATEYKNAIWPLYTQGSSEKLWQGNFASPVPSAILADYGARLRTDGTITGRATGINYNAAAGTAVTAPQAGTVVYAGTLALTGGTVVIDHGCGVKSYLFGLDAVKVQRGQSLARGEELGTTSEEHTLIWELRIGSKSVDPAAALTGSSGLLYRETM